MSDEEETVVEETEESVEETEESTEEPMPAGNGSRRKLVWAIMKLVGAVGLLTVAVNGYLDLEKDNRKLSQQNALLLQALGSKLNRLGEEVAYMRGRLDSLHPSHEAVRASDHPVSRPRPAMDHPRPVSDDSEDEPTAVEVMGAGDPGEEEDGSVEEPPAPLELNAYDDVPTSFEGLRQLQVQVQERLKR